MVKKNDKKPKPGIKPKPKPRKMLVRLQDRGKVVVNNGGQMRTLS